MRLTNVKRPRRDANFHCSAFTFLNVNQYFKHLITWENTKFSEKIKFEIPWMSCGFCWPYFLSDSRWIQINITLIDFCPEAARFFRWLFNLWWLTGCTKNWLFSPSFRVELNTHNEIPSECSGRIRKSYGGRSIFSWDYCTKNGKNLAKQFVCECVNVFAWFNSSPSNRQTEWHRCAWIRTMIAAGCNFNEWYFLPVTMCTECVRSFRDLIFFLQYYIIA